MMQNHFVKYGYMMGIASIVITMILYFIDSKLMLTAGSWISVIAMVYFMVKAVSATRSDQGGIITLSEAFKASWLAFVLGSFISYVFMYILVNFIDTSLIDIIRETQIEAVKQAAQLFKLPEDLTEEQISTIEDTNPYGLAQLAINIPVSFLFPGAIIAIIIAAIMKKNRSESTNV